MKMCCTTLATNSVGGSNLLIMFHSMYASFEAVVYQRERSSETNDPGVEVAEKTSCQ